MIQILDISKIHKNSNFCTICTVYCIYKVHTVKDSTQLYNTHCSAVHTEQYNPVKYTL